MKKVLIIIFTGILVYFPIFFNGFVWDDELMFQKPVQAGVYFRPVITAVYWTIYNVFGSRPFFFHFFQLVFHIATAVLIYYLFKRFFKEIIALILAIVFLVHPANVEAVSFVSAMQETAFTLVGILGLYLFARRDVINHVSTHIFLGTLLLLMALLMKETAIVFFLLVFCYLFLFNKKHRTVLISYSIFSLILLTAYFVFRLSGGNFYTQGQEGLFPIMRVSLMNRLINIPMIIWYYLGKFVYPMNLGIAQHWVVRTVDFQNFWLPLLFETGLFFISVFYIWKTKSKIFVFFFLWFLLGLLPHLQIIPLNMTVAERWLYFPMVGLLGMIGSLLDPRLHGDDKQMSFPRRRESSLLIIIGIIIISLFSIRSFIRILDWRSGLSLFSRDIRRDSSFDLQNNIGVELYRIGRYDEAKKYFEKSTQLAPYWWVNWNNLGASYEREKNIQKAAKYYQKSIENGQYYLAYQNFAKIMVLYGTDPEKTDKFLRTALKIYPEDENLIKINNYFNEKNRLK